MNINFIYKLPNKKNIINISSYKSLNSICIKTILDIINLSNNISIFVSYNSQMEKELIFNLSKLDKNLIDAFIYKISQGLYSFGKYKKSRKCIKVLFYAPQCKNNTIIDIIKSCDFTRNLINEPSNKLTPVIFANFIKKHFKNRKHVITKILDEKNIKKLGLNLIYSIGANSHNKPRFIILDYKPVNYKKTICLAGKGVMIDTGGYSIKNVKGMNNMHMDKEGACMSIGLFDYMTKYNSKNRIICLCPLVENIVSNSSLKPRDIITAYNGQTVEIVNVDAEGRLILADTLAYISKIYKPDYIFDIATLTGNDKYCHTSFSYFTTNNFLSNIAIEKCKEVGEKIIRIPPWVEYMEYIKSDIADVKNSGYTCRHGEDFMASLFLMNFLEKKYRNKWIHFDIRMESSSNTLNIADGYGTILKIINSI
tara:strand:- start:8449 stop:9720 length:1272 start_codon:yes stop_codon:yes gene_type:complete